MFWVLNLLRIFLMDDFHVHIQTPTPAVHDSSVHRSCSVKLYELYFSNKNVTTIKITSPPCGKNMKIHSTGES